MITVGMNYKVRSGKEGVFEKAFLEVLQVLKKGKGNKESFLYQEVKEKNSYLIISEWNYEEAFRNFIRSEAFRNVTDWGKEEILEKRPSHKVYLH